MLCFSVEIIGLLLVGFADDALRWRNRSFLTGGRGSPGVPGIGVVAVSGAAAQPGGGAGDLYRVYGFVVGGDWTTGRIGDELGGSDDLSRGGGTGDGGRYYWAWWLNTASRSASRRPSHQVVTYWIMRVLRLFPLGGLVPFADCPPAG